jgi:hypothetical protein
VHLHRTMKKFIDAKSSFQQEWIEIDEDYAGQYVGTRVNQLMVQLTAHHGYFAVPRAGRITAKYYSLV